MLTRLALTALLGAGCLMLSGGCGGSESTAPTLQDAPKTPLGFAGMLAEPGGTIQTPIGRMELVIDAANLTAEVNPLPLRGGMDNDSVYALPVTEFLRPVDLTIDFIRRTPDAYELGYSLRHPFRSSELSGRADLAFSGMLLMGVEPPGTANWTWFRDDNNMVTDPRWISNADGYYQPEGLVDTTGIRANAFPYQLLVDERGTGNRFDVQTGAPISNGGSPTGNFTAPLGWQTGNTRDWTGYGLLQQGQGVSRVLRVSSEQLTGQGSVPVVLLVLAKYADPKSNTPGFMYRLPADPPDLLNAFGYRLPHGSFDVQQATFVGESGGWEPNLETDNTLGFHVTDWDARATPTALADLSDEPDATKVLPSEPGMPLLAVCIPDVLGDRTVVVPLNNTPIDDDSAYGGDVGQDSGMPGDELFFATTLTKPEGTAPFAGEYLGFLRVIDIEGAGQADYLTALLGDLTPITGEFPLPRIYLPFTVNVGGGCPPNQGIGWATTWGEAVSSFGPRGIAVDSTNAIYAFGDFSTNTDFGGGVRTMNGVQDWYLLKFSSTGTYLWDKTWGGTRQEYTSSIVIDSNDKIWLAGSHQQTFNLGGADLTAIGFVDPVIGRFDTDGDHEFSMNWNGPGFDYLRALTLGPNDELVIAASTDEELDFGGGPLSSNGSEDIVIAVLNPNASYNWARSFGGPTGDTPRHAVMSASGSVYATGLFSGMVDFGLGVRTSAGLGDGFLMRLEAPGDSPVWIKTFGNTENDLGHRILPTAAGVTFAGTFEGTINLGGADLISGTDDASVVLAQFTAAGVHAWSQNFVDPTTNLSVADLTALPDGSTVMVGQFGTTVDFGGGDLPNYGGGEIYLARHSASGAHVWSVNLGSDSGDNITSIRALSNGNLVHGGWFSQDADLEPGCPQTIMPGSPSSATSYVSRMTGDGTW